MGCGGNSGSQERQQAYVQQQQTNRSNKAINQAFSGFDTPFYNKAQQSYMNMAGPQFGQQSLQAQHQLGFDLANRGMVGGGVNDMRQGMLNRNIQQGQQGIANSAVDYRNQLQQQIEQQRARLLQQALTAMNPAQIQQQAVNTAGQFQAPSMFAPIGQSLESIGQLGAGYQFNK